MTNFSYNQNHKEALDSILLDLPQVKPGKMFGYPAYYVGKKLFACVYEDAIAIKVPQELAEVLLKKRHVTPFQPMGRPKMREWIQLNRKRSDDYAKDKETFLASIKFISSLEKKGKKK